MTDFFDILSSWPESRIRETFSQVTSAHVQSALAKDHRGPEDLIALLSPQAIPYLEAIASEAHKITRRQFGRTISLYAPIYLSNVCGSKCAYCSFSATNHHDEERITLTPEQISGECQALSRMGYDSVLLLTGDAVMAANPGYIAKACEIARSWFSSVAVEVYSMDEEEYRLLCDHGLDGVTLYQETYHLPTYAQMHSGGRKQDYLYRLAAPERASRAGVRRLGIGILLGLYDWRLDSVWLALHGKWLQQRCWSSALSVSFPRLRNTPPSFRIPHTVADIDLVQMMVAMRLFLPEAGFNLSTREDALFREQLLPLGVTSMSAGSSTRPGGYASPDSGTPEQFRVEDQRTPSQIEEVIRKAGYDPVWKDFDSAFIEPFSKET